MISTSPPCAHPDPSDQGHSAWTLPGTPGLRSLVGEEKRGVSRRQSYGMGGEHLEPGLGRYMSLDAQGGSGWEWEPSGAYLHTWKGKVI